MAAKLRERAAGSSQWQKFPHIRLWCISTCGAACWGLAEAENEAEEARWPQIKAREARKLVIEGTTNCTVRAKVGKCVGTTALVSPSGLMA